MRGGGQKHWIVRGGEHRHWIVRGGGQKHWIVRGGDKDNLLASSEILHLNLNNQHHK